MNQANPTQPRLKFRFFGGCKFQCEGKNVRPDTTKTGALLAYLALQSRLQPRHKLIGLFWGDQPEANARRSLRHSLWNIRQQFHCLDQAPVLLSDAQEIAFNHAAGAWIDVQDFERCLKSEAGITAAAARPDDRYALLRQAAELYCGDLLDGVFVNDAPEFEQWLLVERERLRALAIETLQRLVGYCVGWGEHAMGLGYAHRLLELEPWLEEAHQQTMRLLALSGQRSAALAQYETCRCMLAEELNAVPSQETQALYEIIRANTGGNLAERSTPQRKLPPQATPFIGREEELTQLAARLGDPACRLITLVGPGGIGKTRLAVRAAAKCERFRDGIYFVPLAGVASSDLLIPAVADALGLTLHGSESMQAQLLEWLDEKELLLILDNFEHLLAAAELNTEILCAAPGVKILVTSRERLNLREEWIFQVEGLRYPLQEDENSSALSLDTYAAVQLFVQGAQRVHLGFMLGNAEKPLVARVCRLVDGTPLAIELAANWVRLLSCQEIVVRIEQSMDFLTTTLRDLPVRHRSMGAVFEQSWQMLSEDEREVFKRLTVFRGGFCLEAAEPVAGANLDLLASLVDKSFLRRTPSGRYEMHELLRQYGEKKLSEAENTQTLDEHCVYFARFLFSHEEAIDSKRLADALEEIAEEIENIQASWNWATQRRLVHEIKQSFYSLIRFYELRSWFQEGEAAMERAAEAINSLAPEREQQCVLLILYNGIGMFCNRLSRYNKAIRMFEAGLSLSLQLNHRRSLHILSNLATAHFMHGAFFEARQLLEETLAGFREKDDRLNTCIAQVNLGYVLCQIGDYPNAHALLDQALKDFQNFVGRDEIALAHYFLGLAQQGEGDNEQAARCFRSGLDIYHELSHSWGTSLCLSGLASLAIQNGEYDQAAQLAQEGLAYARKVGDAYVMALCLNCMGQMASALGHDNEATGYHLQAIQTAWETEQFPPVLDGLIGMAELELKGGQMQSAGELLAFAIHHPSTCARERDRAARWFVQLESQLTPEAIMAAQKQTLEAVVERIFTSYG